MQDDVTKQLKMLPCAKWLRDDLCDGPSHVFKLIQEGLVVALVVQYSAGSGANDEEVRTEGQACDIAWGSSGGHLEGAFALFLPRVMYWVHSHSACMHAV